MASDLSQLYTAKKDTYFLHNQAYVEGIIVGACACPEIPLPDVWLPWTIKLHNKVENNKQADRIFEQLFEYFREVLASIKQQKVVLPSYIDKPNIDDNEYMQDFLSGVLFAHQASERVWQTAWDKMASVEPDKMQVQAKGLKHCLMMFSTFANVKQAIKRADKQNNPDMIEKLPQIAKSLPEAFTKYLEISDTLVAYLPDQFESVDG